MSRTGWIALALALVVGGQLARADDARVKETLGFAEYLRGKGDYYRAITEYERALFLAPSNALRKSVCRSRPAISKGRNGRRPFRCCWI